MATFLHHRLRPVMPVSPIDQQVFVDSTPHASARFNRPGSFFTRPWLGVLSRSLAAIFGGYALSATCSMFFAVALPIARGQAVLTGMMVAIVLCACAALWAFATRTALRAWVGILVPTLLFWVGTRLLQGVA